MSDSEPTVRMPISPAEMSRWTLTFRPPLEREFLDEYTRNTLVATRIAIVVGIGIFAVFGLLDPLIVPDVKRQVWFIRYAIACPGLMLGLMATFLPRLRRHMQLILALLIVFAGFGIIAMVAISGPPNGHLYYAGLILVVMYGYAFLRMRFVHAVASCVLLTLGYEVTALWIAPTGTAMLVNNTFFLVAANVIGMAASYSIELYIRRDFLQNRLIERHTRELRDKNQQLVAANDELARSKHDLVQSVQRTELIFSALTETLPGTVLDDKYRVDEKIGAGGFGTVYRATHLLLQNAVAVKVFRPSVGADPLQHLERLKREGISASRLRHPHVVTVLDFGVCAGSIAYMVMELLEGWSLKDELDATHTVAVPRALSIAIPVCKALAHSHEMGIIHRDVKPSNTFLHQSSEGELVKLVDFGVAKVNDDAVDGALHSLTVTGALIGTPVYMAPERLGGRPYDGHSDVYSVGIMLYEMLCGQLPFDAERDNYWSMVLMHMTSVPASPRSIASQIPESLDALIMRMLDKDPTGRPSANEAALALAECAAHCSNPSDARVSPELRARLLRREPRTLNAGVFDTASGTRTTVELGGEGQTPPPAASEQLP